MTSKPITIVISTHTHVDHTGSNVDLDSAESIEFVAHENTRANLAREKCATVGGCQTFQGDQARYLPKKTFKDKLSLLDGKDRIELSYYGRAHTNGDIVVVFPALRLAHVGDLLGWQGVPRVMTEDGGSVLDFPETLRKAQAAINNVDTIISGHSRVMPWKDWVEVRDFLTYYVAEVKAASKAGKTVDEAVAGMTWPDRFGRRRDGQSAARLGTSTLRRTRPRRRRQQRRSGRSIAVNVVTTNTIADLEPLTTTTPIALNGNDLTLTATSNESSSAIGDAKQAGDGSTSGSRRLPRPERRQRHDERRPGRSLPAHRCQELDDHRQRHRRDDDQGRRWCLGRQRQPGAVGSGSDRDLQRHHDGVDRHRT